MIESPDDGGQSAPSRAVGISLAALLIPVVGTLALPERLSGLSAILWLAALAPTFPFAFHRGWRGVATSTAFSGAVLISTLVASTLMGREIPPLLTWIVVAYLVIAAGIGRVAHLLHRQHASVQDLALTDNLTRLPNRRHARMFLENEFAAGKRGHLLSVVLFDLDGFKAFNDLHGHRAGDRALERFGEILASTTRRMNLSSRFGGEEFLSVLSGSDEAGALVFAERVRGALESVRLQQGSLTVSAGIAACHPSMRSSDELIAAADLALYRAKGDGRNCVRIFGRPHDESEEDMPGEGVDGGSADRVRAAFRPSLGEGAYLGSEEEIDHSPPLPDDGLAAALSIARAVELRDPHRADQISRIADYADTIARAAGMIPSPIDSVALRVACELHDVGEIGVPEEILTKKGPLTREEFLQVQQHPLIGRRILKPLLSDKVVLAATKWHHERWDGSGYPDGLAGEAIPLAARIVAIADALDAMTSPRAYRPALPWHLAVEQISGLGGSQFDPALIDRFRMALPELESLATASGPNEG